LVLSSGG